MSNDDRTIIVGPVGSGKSTLAAQLCAERGLRCFQCTDTAAQAKRHVDGALYVPSAFDKDWSGASKFVFESWLMRPGPWVIEGMAAIRALRKYREAHRGGPVPCERLIVLRQSRISTSTAQDAMWKSDSARLQALLESWPELRQVTEWRS